MIRLKASGIGKGELYPEPLEGINLGECLDGPASSVAWGTCILEGLRCSSWKTFSMSLLKNSARHNLLGVSSVASGSSYPRSSLSSRPSSSALIGVGLPGFVRIRSSGSVPVVSSPEWNLRGQGRGAYSWGPWSSWGACRVSWNWWTLGGCVRESNTVFSWCPRE